MNIRKEIKEWGIFALIIGLLYFTGLHTEVAAFAQRIVLSTGLMTPDTEAVGQDKMDYNFELMDLEGNVVPVKELKNKVLFINLWATWCGPCVAEMPGIQSLYNEVGNNENIVFVMLSLDNSADKARKFIERKKFTFPVYGATGPLPEILQSSSIPTTYVVSKEGIIVSKKVGMAKYDTDKFQKYLLELAAE